MPIELYPNIAKVKRNGVYQNLPGFVPEQADLAIEAMLANSETSTTAQYEHIKNSFFILNDTLYQTDEYIGVNGTISVGTNCHVAVFGDVVADLINDVEENNENVSDLVVVNPNSKNMLDYTKVLANKYLHPNGVMENYNGRTVTDYIPIRQGQYAIASYVSSNNWNPTKTLPATTCFYDKNKNVISGGGYNADKIAPNNAAYVRLTIGYSYYLTKFGMVTVQDDTSTPSIFSFYLGEDTKSLNNELIVPEKKLGYMRATGDLNDAQSLTLPYHNCKNNNVYVFVANITNFDKIKIGKESDTYIIIDDTNVTLYNEQGTYTQAHGLTIAYDIQVRIENESAIAFSKITVVSGGVEFNYPTGARFLMDNGTAYVLSDGSTLTDCVFSWSSRNINKPIWLFGDSFFSWYAERWTYYLARDGFTDSCMLNGYAGEASADAYTALRNLLNVRVPEYLVWCIGMNNGDSESAVSAAWNLYYNAIKDLANYYGFTLILATIPTTPTVNNDFKNSIIRNSGYRYIEFDKAVNPDGTGDWIPGTREENGVHPTAKGAKILFYQALADLPELTTH